MKFYHYLKKSNNALLWILFSVFFALSIILSLLDVIPSRDVAFRYAPMAEAFAIGDWDFAFHPRVPLAMSVIAGGLCWLLKCSGFMACKIVSSLFYSLTVFPVYGIGRRVFKNDHLVIFISVILAGLCSHLIRLGSSGLRDSIKEFAIALAVYGIISIYQQRNKFNSFLWCFIGVGLLILSRVDAVLFALIIAISALIFDLIATKIRFPWRTLVSSLVTLLIILPNLIYNYHTVGYPVPESRFAVIIDKVIPQIYNKNAIPGLHRKKVVPNQQISPAPTLSTTPAKVSKTVSKTVTKVTQKITPVHTIKSGSENDLKQYFRNITIGIYPYYFFFALIVIIYRIKCHLWTKEETILLSAYLIHTIGVLAQIVIHDRYFYVSPRYLTPGTVLYLYWTAICLIAIAKFLYRTLPRKIRGGIVSALISGCVIALILDGAGPIIKDYTSNKKIMRRKHSIAIAKRIRQHYQTFKVAPSPTPIINIFSYRVNKSPAIYSNDLKVVSYLANGRNITLNNIANSDYIVYSYRENLTKKNKPIHLPPKFTKAQKICIYQTISRNGKYRYTSHLFFNNQGEMAK